ncbi:MAG: GAF domain-containing sensor histidine kinase [Eubacterium sp.]|jgi:two-component system sensor histidine kinase NreB
MRNRDYSAFLQAIRKKYNFDFVSIALVVQRPRPLLSWISASGNQNQYYHDIVLESGKGIAGNTYQAKRGILINSVQEELSGMDLVETPIILAENLASLLALPLWKEDQVEGVLMMAFRAPSKFSKACYEKIVHEIAVEELGLELYPEPYEAVRDFRLSGDYRSVPIYELARYPVMKAREEERQRIARDLHDSVVQNVLGVQMLLRSLKYKNSEKEREEVLVQADSWLNNIQNELRGISHGLRPNSLDDFGITAALNSHFRLIEEGYHVTVDFLQNTANIRYNKDIETVFYRICQEATMNACKYGEVDVIHVSLYDAGDTLTLEVTDYGAGFDTDHPEIRGGGQGMKSMADWARTIDGEFRVISSPGRGTKVHLSAPIHDREDGR